MWPQCNQLGLTAAQENGHVVHLHYHYSASTMHKLIPRMLKMQSYIEKVAVSNVRSYRIPAMFPYQWLGRLPLVSFGHERWSARFESCSSKQAVRSALQAANALGLPPHLFSCKCVKPTGNNQHHAHPVFTGVRTFILFTNMTE